MAATMLRHNIGDGYARGWSFTPLRGKVPILPGWQNRPRPSLEQVLEWAEKGNIGLRTGRASKVVVVDADPGADLSTLNLPKTVTALTGRKGAKHLYFHYERPLGNSAGKIGPHIDIRADSGQVVFPGSLHPKTKHEYRWLEGHEPWSVALAELPMTLIPSYSNAALQRECAAVAAAAEGERNDTLNKAAFNLGTLIPPLLRSDVESALRGAARNTGLSSAEIEATIRSGIDAGLLKPRIKKKKRQKYILVPGSHNNQDDKYIEQSSADFAREVIAALPQDTIYRRDFLPGELRGSDGKRRWNELTIDRMRIIVDTHTKLGKWVTSKKHGTQVIVYIPCGKDGAGLAIAGAQNSFQLRDLNLIVGYPVYGPGFKRVRSGWHNGIYFDESKELLELKPERDCDVIHNVMYDLVADFPFKSEADRQNFFGLLVTPIVAPAIDGPRPMHLINSPLERTGKSKLVNEVLGGVILARDTPSMQITEREEEREKRILAMLLQCATIMHLDNLPRYIDSPSLSSLLTSQRFQGRLLGLSRMLSLANTLTVVGTGNNVQASGEITKRTIPIMLEPTSSTPEARTDFQHPDIRAYVREHRRRVIECLLGMVENWLAAGRPLHTSRLGGFEAWSETIGGILQVNGLREWRKNELEWRAQANPSGVELEALVTAWDDKYGAGEVKARDIRELAERDELFGRLLTKPSASFARMLGNNVNRPVLAWRIRRRGDRTHRVYYLEKL